VAADSTCPTCGATKSKAGEAIARGLQRLQSKMVETPEGAELQKQLIETARALWVESGDRVQRQVKWVVTDILGAMLS